MDSLIIRLRQIFVDFLGTGEPKIQMFNELQIFYSGVCLF